VSFKRFWSPITALALLFAMPAARAEGPPDGPHVKASLVAETQAIVPGQPLHLALRQEIQPGWHTYWINPGDSGLPTGIDWSLPAGFVAEPIQWPIPKRIVYGPLASYGYEGSVLLPVTVTVPSKLDPGANVTLSGHANWLVCEQICVPEESDVSLTLPVSAGPAAPSPRWAPDFAATRAQIPVPSPFPATATSDGKSIRLKVATGDSRKLGDIAFLPLDTGAIDNMATQRAETDRAGLSLTLARPDKASALKTLDGVLTFRDTSAGADSPLQAIAISAPLSAAPAAAPMSGSGLVEALALAILGGIILNLMPCVLPVLSIKALGLVKHAQETPREARLQGLAYMAGILVSFALVAGALILLRAAGAEIGWGFQLQSPVFVTAMIYILFAVGLSLSGVFSLGDGLAGIGSGLAAREGYAGSFFTGALATLVATPCTAPFMAAAIGYAITQPWYMSLTVFEAIGLGLAIPYLALAFIPGARRFLPKPGAWMHRFKQVLAFPVYGTAVWLGFVLASESGSMGITAALAGLVLIAFAAWLFEAVKLGEGARRGWGLGFSALAVIGAVALMLLPETTDASTAQAEAVQPGGLAWQPFSQERLDALLGDGKPVFVDFTADWCITCKVNERVAFGDQKVKEAFRQKEIVALRGDWTRRDAAITRVLEANGRAGVPLYLYYPERSSTGERRPPVVLPQILTPDTVLEQLTGG
jgi:thiol:disulfide interchange protein DsbD